MLSASDWLFLYDAPLIYIFLGQLIFFPLVTFLGLWVGKKDRQNEARESSALIPTTVMGLLALILGFTFSMSVERYDARKNLVVSEANAIGTSLLRAETLDGPYRSQMRDSFKKYVDVRIALFDPQTAQDRLAGLRQESGDLQQTIWQNVVNWSRKNRGDVTVPLVLESVNSVIDAGAEREFASLNRVPILVYLIIFTITTIGLFSLGFMYGVEHKTSSSRWGIVVMSVLFAVVIGLIKDLDNPRRGLIHIDQASMMDVKKSLR